MAILKLKKLLKTIAGRGNGVLDRDFRHIIRQIPFENKRELILEYGDEAAKRRAMSKKDDGKRGESETKARSPQDLAEDVGFWTVDFPSASAVVPLREALEAADARWIGAFRDAEGVSGLCGVMEGLADSRDLHLEEGDSMNPKQVPQEERQVEEEIVRCMMVLLNKKAGLSTLEGSANLWPVIARSAMDSTSESVRSSLLKVLTVMAETGTNGLKVVLNALDVVKAQKNNDLRFLALVEALAAAKENAALPVAIGITVFLNTILSSAFEFDERVLLRGEMIEAGMLQAVEHARSWFGVTVDELFADSDSSDDEGSESTAGKPAQATAGAVTKVFPAYSKRREEGMLISSGSSSSSTASLASTGTGKSIFSPLRKGGGRPATLPTLAKATAAVADARVTLLKRELAAQLDLFDRVTDEDAMDAMANAGIDGSGHDLGEEDGEDTSDKGSSDGDAESGSGERSSVKAAEEPQAVKAMRALTAAVEGDEAVSVELELIADKLGLMGGAAGCGPELWRRVRDAVTAAAEQGLSAGSGSDTGIPSAPPNPGAPPAVLPRCPALPPAAGPISLPPPGPIPQAPGLPPPVAIPAAPPLPIPPAPALPIPAAPPLPIPPAPALPIPAAPALPIPAIPALPPRKGVPLPPVLPLGKGPPAPSLPLGKKKLVLPPGPRRRGVFWTMIKAEVTGTVFEDIKANEVDVPKELLLEGFAEKPKEPKKLASAGGSGDGGEEGAADNGGEEDGNDKKKAKMEPVLGAKALQYGIVFKTVNVSPEKVRDAVMSMDLSFLDADTLEKLGKLQPQPAELATLKAFKGELSELVEVEQFMVLASRIPSYNARLRCAHIMQSLAPNVDFTMSRLEVVDKAITEVTNSEKLKRLLAAVLAVGNFLNEGTGRAATAITLDSILKLPNVRRTTKRTSAGGGEDNLVHALVEWASTAEPSLLLIGEDLAHAASASRLSLEDLKKEVLSCSKDFRVLEAKLEEAQKSQEGGEVLEGDKLVETIEPFLARSKELLEKLKSKNAGVEEAYNAVAAKFGENPRTTPNEKFFTLIKDVVLMIELAARENEERAEAEAARIRRKNRADKRKKERSLAKAAKQEKDVNLQSLLLGGATRLRGVVTGTVNDEYDRIKEERAKENEAFRELSETADADEREHMRDQLRYQRSVSKFNLQRQISTSSSSKWGADSPRSNGRAPPFSGNLTARHDRKASALRQASFIRQNTALQQASFARVGSRVAQRDKSGDGGVRRSGSTVGVNKTPSIARERTSRLTVAGGASVPAPPLGGGGDDDGGRMSSRQSGLGRSGRSPVVCIPPQSNGGKGDDRDDGSASPKASRGALSRRLIDTRGRTLDSRRGPIG